MLKGKVSVHDIKDVEAFVRSAIPKTRLKLDSQERDELLAEGIVLLLELAQKFQPRMAGYDRDGSFAGYCSKYLHLKMSTAWHNMHPEHLLETRTINGRSVKRYRYGEAAASWDEQLERDNGLDSDRLRTVGDFAR